MSIFFLPENKHSCRTYWHMKSKTRTNTYKHQGCVTYTQHIINKPANQNFLKKS